MGAVNESSPYMRAQNNLSELKLDRMAAAMPDYVRMVAGDERDFAQAIAEMTDSEVAARRERIMRQRIRSSGFPFVKTLSDFDWSFQPSVPRAKVEELATLRFVDDAENALFVGSPGVGKSQLACALGKQACKHGLKTLYVRMPDMLAYRSEKMDAGWPEKKVLNKYAAYKVLIIDEHLIDKPTKEQMHFLLELTERRYDNSSTIYCSQYGIEDWHRRMGGGAGAGRKGLPHLQLLPGLRILRGPGVPESEGLCIPHPLPHGRSRQAHQGARPPGQMHLYRPLHCQKDRGHQHPRIRIRGLQHDLRGNAGHVRRKGH